MAKKQAQETWVLEWMQEHGAVDACNEHFHDDFHNAFGGKRKTYMYGAAPVLKAQRLLSKMWRDGKLRRFIVSLPEHVYGFPNWVYVYELKK